MLYGSLDLGEWDGAGAVVKRALRNEQLRNPDKPMQNALHCVEFLRTRFTSRVASSYARSTTFECDRSFWHIEMGDVCREDAWACHTLPGSRSLHSVMGYSITDPTLLLVRQLSCFCMYCVQQDWDNCDRKSHVAPWRHVRLRPHNAANVICQVEENDDPEGWEFDGVREDLGDLVEVGDNFAVPAPPGNDEGVAFYILQCQRKKFRVLEDFECPWGGSYKVGDYVLGGAYYKKSGRGSNTYVFLDKAVTAHVDAHLVRACKFPMVLAHHRVKGGDPVYKLQSKIEEAIAGALRAWWETV